MRNEVHFKSMCKWIMNSRATKHMTSYKAAFDMYEVNATHYVYLGDDIVVKAIGMRSIIVKAIIRCNINRVCIKMVFHMPK